MAKAKEQFPQSGYLSVIESAADTLTFNGLSVFSNVLGQKGMVLHRCEYSFDYTSIDRLSANQDGVIFGLAGDDSATTIALDDAEVYDYNLIETVYHGAAASANAYRYPVMKDWTGLPGGGKLVPADRLYGYVAGNNLSGAMALYIRFEYTIVDLSAQEYLELAQALRVLK
jgi:hypothetical protein